MPNTDPLTTGVQRFKDIHAATRTEKALWSSCVVDLPDPLFSEEYCRTIIRNFYCWTVNQIADDVGVNPMELCRAIRALNKMVPFAETK